MSSANTSPADRLKAPFIRVHQWAQAVQARPVHSLVDRIQRFFAKTIEVLLLVCRWDVIAHLQLHAQALTYDTLLALVPLMAVAFAVVAGFGGLDTVREQLIGLVLDQVSGSDEMRQQVATYLESFTGNIRTGSFSAVSVVILAFSAMSLLNHIETAVNAIFGTKNDRPILTRFLTYWAALTLGPLLLGASFGLSAAFTTSWVANALNDLGLGGVFLRLVPLIMTWLSLMVLYLVVPRTRIKLSSALFGAVVAGSLWTLAKNGYAIYAKNAFTVQSIYGSLATIPLFILLIYLSWLLVLAGAQLTFAYQHALTYHKEELGLRASMAYRERVACRVFLEIARDFLLGNPPTDLDALATHLDVPRRLLESITGDLRTGGYVREVFEGAGLVPARDIEHVTVAELLDYVRRGVGSPLVLLPDVNSGALDAIFKTLDEDRDRTGKIAFRDLIGALTHPSA